MEKTRRLPRSLALVLASLVIGLGASLVGTSAASAASVIPVAQEATAPSESSSPFQFKGSLKDGQTPLEGVAITVTGEGFEQTVTSDAAGTWAVGLPAAGSYTVTLDTSTLPDGVTLRDASFESREFEVGSTASIGVLFPFGEASGTATATPGATTTPESSGSSSSSSGSSFISSLFNRVLSGLNFGLLLALAAIGITLIFGTTGVNNFAHGELVTFGGLIFYWFTTLIGVPWWLGIPIAVVAGGLLGWGHDAALFKPMRKRRVGLVQVLIFTIGLSIALRYFYQFLIGGGTEQLRVPTGGVARIFGANITVANLSAMIVSIVILVLFGLFMTRTRTGKAMRAVSDNSSLAAASGINVDKIIRIVWVLAGALTALAGVFYTYFIGANIRWDMGFNLLLLLFAAVTLGGLGNAFGALVGALIIGLTTEVSTLWIPSDLRYALALVILILVLLFRPQGVLGRKERIG